MGSQPVTETHVYLQSKVRNLKKKGGGDAIRKNIREPYRGEKASSGLLEEVPFNLKPE